MLKYFKVNSYTSLKLLKAMRTWKEVRNFKLRFPSSVIMPCFGTVSLHKLMFKDFMDYYLIRAHSCHSASKQRLCVPNVLAHLWNVYCKLPGAGSSLVLVMFFCKGPSMMMGTTTQPWPVYNIQVFFQLRKTCLCIAGVTDVMIIFNLLLLYLFMHLFIFELYWSFITEIIFAQYNTPLPSGDNTFPNIH